MMYEKFGWKTFWIALAFIACTALLMWGIVVITQSNNQPETIKAKAEARRITIPVVVKDKIIKEIPKKSPEFKDRPKKLSNREIKVIGIFITIGIILVVILVYACTKSPYDGSSYF